MTTEIPEDYYPLDSQKSVDEFLNLTHGLHDCCIPRFFWESPMHVDSKGSMIFLEKNFPGQSNLIVYLQSQILTGCAIELKFFEVDYFACEGISARNDGIISAVKLELGNFKVVTFNCNPHEKNAFFKVKASKAFWRLRKNFFGLLNVTIEPSLPILPI